MENWPLPPFFKDGRPRDELAPVEAIAFTSSGDTVAGALLAFLPEVGTAVLRLRGESDTRPLKFAELDSIQLINPIPLVPDTDLIDLYRKCGGQDVAPASLEFTVDFTSGEHLGGRTRGFVRTAVGLFLFLSLDDRGAVRIFVPTRAIKSMRIGRLLGEQLVANGEITPPLVASALQAQDGRRQPPINRGLRSDRPGDAAAFALSTGQVGTLAPVRLGDVLMNHGLVSRDQLLESLQRKSRDSKSLLGNILVDMGAITRAQLTRAVAEQCQVPLVSIRNFVIAPATLSLVPRAFAFKHQVLPLLMLDKTLVVAIESPVDADYLDELRFIAQRKIVPVVAGAEELSQRITREYAGDRVDGTAAFIAAEIEELTRRLSADQASGAEPGNATASLQRVSEDDTLLVRIVNTMIEDAHKQGASDIHIEAYPEPQPTRIRFRIDGVLTNYFALPHFLRAAMISRLKIMANIDISQHRTPQDGKIDFSRFAPVNLELRVATLPTTNNLEDVVMRLLAASKPIPLDKLGVDGALAAQLNVMVHRSYGLFLVCGPTGSGKTTTLHSLLAEVNTTENKIWTAEDPIEITQSGLRQIQMLPRAGLTFATAMRAFLRADPDIIMVGEMRDSETAHMAIEASLTGHLVMSTLHTNSAPESVVRLLDMGLDPFNFSDALVGVLSQRLARRLCAHCKAPVERPWSELRAMARAYVDATSLEAGKVLADWAQRLGTPARCAPRLYKAMGCAACGHTGYKGRVGIYELMTATPGIKKLIQSRAPVQAVLAQAMSEGMLRLVQYGMLKVLDGLTDRRSVLNACA